MQAHAENALTANPGLSSNGNFRPIADILAAVKTMRMDDQSSDYEHDYFIASPGPRPPFNEVVQHVYGERTVDTDGDSHPRDSTNWTWLYMQLREPPYREQPVIEVVMLDQTQSVMRVSSDDKELAEAAARFLAERTGGTLTFNAAR